MLLQTLKAVGKALLASLLTEKFIKEMIIYLLEWLAKKSDNTIDDDIVKKVKEAMNESDKKS